MIEGQPNPESSDFIATKKWEEEEQVRQVFDDEYARAKNGAWIDADSLIHVLAKSGAITQAEALKMLAKLRDVNFMAGGEEYDPNAEVVEEVAAAPLKEVSVDVLSLHEKPITEDGDRPRDTVGAMLWLYFLDDDGTFNDVFKRSETLKRVLNGEQTSWVEKRFADLFWERVASIPQLAEQLEHGNNKKAVLEEVRERALGILRDESMVK